MTIRFKKLVGSSGRMRWILSILLVAALAGCLDDADPSPDEAATGEAIVDEALSEWRMSTIDRDVITTMNLAAYAVLEGTDAFSVSSDATQLVVNATVTATTPNGLSIRLTPPDCDPLGGGCSEYIVTSDSAQLVIDDPAAGEWTVVAFSDLVATVGSFHLDIGQLVVAQPPEDEAADDEGA